MSMNNSIVATYGKASLAEADAKHLREFGFQPGKLALLGDGEHGICGGFNALDGALYRCIPPEDVAAYEAELRAGRLVLVVYGTAEEIVQAKRLLEAAHPMSWDESADATVYYGCVD